MPLTSVVDYLNGRLSALHPRAHLRQRARYRIHRGSLTAEVAGFVLTPALMPVVRAATGEVFGQRARLHVNTQDGQSVPPESLYVQAWDAEDVLYLDRFLRTFQALNYLQQGYDGREPLTLDVHLRHLAAQPEHHGEVFETLLHHLGLRPDQVILRLDGQALHLDPHVQGAAMSFTSHGYRLVAARPDIEHTDWDLLRSLGVHWVSPHHRDLETLLNLGSPDHRGHETQVRRVGLWLDGIDSPRGLAQARALGADLIEGDMALPDSMPLSYRSSLNHEEIGRQKSVIT
jgi:hypothetical protein